MSEYSKPSGKVYPLILEAHNHYVIGSSKIDEKIVYSDAEYNSQYDYFIKKGYAVKEMKTTEMRNKEFAEALKQKEFDLLNKRKLIAEVTVAERTIKQYKWTYWSARIAFIISLLVFYLQLAQIFKWLPFR